MNHQSTFDYCGYHPNIEAIRTTPHKAYQYVLKDGDIIHEEGNPPSQPAERKNEKWHHVMEASTKEEFLERMRKENPKEMIIHFNSVMNYANHHFQETPKVYKSIPITCHCERYPTLVDWVQTNLRSSSPGRTRSLILYGDTRIGKTLWARSLGAHAYFPTFFNMDNLNTSTATYAIFDDIVDGLDGIPSFKAWLGGQMEITINDKYRRKKTIEWGKPSIYLSNEDPREGRKKVERDWINGNCTVFNLTGIIVEPFYE